MTELGKAYGNALFLLASEEKLEDELQSELQAVCAVESENPEYSRLIDSPAVTKAERLQLLDNAFSGKVHTYLLNFLKILCERGSFSELKNCSEAFGARYDEEHGILPATAISASALSEEQERRLVEALEKKSGKKIRLTKKVDPSLRGGMCVEMNGVRYDNTVSTKLNRLRRALSANS